MDVVPSPGLPEKVNEKSKNIPLPEGINLLSSKEIIDLIQTHRHQLEDQFKQLEENFEDLHEQKDKVQALLENCRILESKYVASWQDYHSEFSGKYGDIALKKKLEQNTKKLDEESSQLETTTRSIDSADDLDQFIKNYLDVRTQYHLRREKLATWDKQGNLKY
ncbi:CBM_collapsed_G0038860.mRNA.1.CDS.1 [Saccharomyces cerevisiae]|nr:CBM_collapsed_G0038860.mRNA.1.CDS.1 [Saccharomyces cerevisiae]